MDLLTHVNQLKIRLDESIIKKLKYQKLVLDSFTNSFVIKNPLLLYQNKQQQLDLDIEKINKLILDNIERKKIKLDQFKNNYILNNPVILYQNYMKELNNFLEKLELLNPISVLKKGYSLTYYNGTILSSIKTVKKDDSFTEDSRKIEEQEIQKLTDNYIKKNPDSSKTKKQYI